MTYHERRKENPRNQFAPSDHFRAAQPVQVEDPPLPWLEPAPYFVIGIVLATLFWWLADYQTQVPCPEPQLLLPSGAVIDASEGVR